MKSECGNMLQARSLASKQQLASRRVPGKKKPAL
jgi:hypothetical protein